MGATILRFERHVVGPAGDLGARLEAWDCIRDQRRGVRLQADDSADVDM
jgi:hypothetical protein